MSRMRRYTLILCIPRRYVASNIKFSVAPMMDYTDRHQRYFMRLLSKHAVLYTEMITAAALVNTKDAFQMLRFNRDIEEPVVLQLGGACPQQMQLAAKIALQYGYREININCGCPSEKVSGKGCFGAALMLQPKLVAELCLSIAEVTNTSPTVKCRIGVDNNDSYEELCAFINTIHCHANVEHFIIHARKAILGKKFTPKQNREIPPLNYNIVYQLKQDFPALQFTLNGGVNSLQETLEQHNRGVEGVMVGRAVVKDPYAWRDIDKVIYSDNRIGMSRGEVVHKYADYAEKIAEEHIRDNRPLPRSILVKPITNMFFDIPRGKLFKNALMENSRNRDMPIKDAILRSMDVLSEDVL